MTADLVILTIREQQLTVLLVTRRWEPYARTLALPGGFLRLGEAIEDTARRELREETGLIDDEFVLRQVKVYSELDRDSRGRVVTCSFLAIAPHLPLPVAGTDAMTAQWVPVSKVRDGGIVLAFDHHRILDDALTVARSMLQYTTIATSFCPSKFTINELRSVYETVWGVRLDRSNFYRKVTQSSGFVESTGTMTMTSGRPAKLYTAGSARTLTNPVLPPSLLHLDLLSG